jgi:hypothetical protein
MSSLPVDENDMPAEIDFSQGVSGIHHIPAGAKVLMPLSIEPDGWEYSPGSAEA